jgi:SH3 domain protein
VRPTARSDSDNVNVNAFSRCAPFSLQRLPRRGNSENIATMKTFAANRCLLIATMSLATMTLPLVGYAQEQPLNEAQPVPQPSVQPIFVSDKLVLNVYSEPDQGSSRVATIQTGDAIEELERSANMVRVRLEDGREGWVGANYLTSDPPAITRLRELQREQKAATRGSDKAFSEEIAKLKKQNSALQARVSELQARPPAPIAPPVAESQLMAANAAEVVNESQPLAAAAPAGMQWGWVFAAVVTGALGFAGGYQTLARRLRRKFGALKIY